MALQVTQKQLVEKALSFGAELAGIASAQRWEERGEMPKEQRPRSLWTQAQTVLVMAVPLWLPLVEAAPTVLGREQVIVANRILEKAAYKMVLFLRDQGVAAVSLTESSNGTTPEEPQGFSNVWAGYYAGLGTIGQNRALLTQEYGPRIQLKAIFTDLQVAASVVQATSLCHDCGLCKELCPAQALPQQGRALDYKACHEYEGRLRQAFCDPCSNCIKVCPVGEDRVLFKSQDSEKYRREKTALEQNPQQPEDQSWVHLRSYGSYPLK